MFHLPSLYSAFFLLDFFPWPGDGPLEQNAFALESRSQGGRPGLRLSLWGCVVTSGYYHSIYAY